MFFFINSGQSNLKRQAWCQHPQNVCMSLLPFFFPLVLSFCYGAAFSVKNLTNVQMTNFFSQNKSGRNSLFSVLFFVVEISVLSSEKGKKTVATFFFKMFRIIFFFAIKTSSSFKKIHYGTGLVLTSSPASYRSSSWSSSCCRALAALSCRSLWALLPSSFLVGRRSLWASRMWSESTDLVVNQLEQWGHGSPSPSCSSES